MGISHSSGEKAETRMTILLTYVNKPLPADCFIESPKRVQSC